MYFSVKAFNGTTRRFENLDNLFELNAFVAERIQMGYTKFLVKAYDQDGMRSVSYFSTFANPHRHLLALGAQYDYAVRICKRTIREA